MRELVATLAGVIVGWIFNEITMFFRERPKLTFKMVSTPETELIDKEYRTKTSLSEHGIEIYNTGKNPFILESFELCYKNKLLVDCHIVENAKVLMPSESFTYTLMEQEADALQHHCKHFMDIMNGSYAETHFPCKLWDAGEKGLTLSAFEWEKDRKTLIYGQVDYMYGEALYKPEMKEGNPIRLYSLDEITEIFCKLGLRICNSFADFSGKPSSDNDIQLMVYSIRE